MNRSEDGNLWLLLEFLARKRTMIVGIVTLATVASIITVLILPKWYQATVLLLPPKDTAITIPEMVRMSEMMSITSGVDLPTQVTPSDVYARILKSRTITDAIIERFDLMTRYKTSFRHLAYETLLDHSQFKVTDEGLLEVAFEDRDPILAAEIANAFVEQLKRVNRDIATGRAQSNRRFLQERLDQVKSELDNARSELEYFQLANRTIDFDQQIRLAIEQAISLKINLAAAELELGLKEQKLGRDNTELVELRRRRLIIKDQIDRLENSNADSSFFSLPVSVIPSLKGQFEVLYSRVQVNESLYTLLLKQLEQAKIQENSRATAISILDPATPPDVKHRPKRALIVLATFGISLMVAIFLAMFLQYLELLRTKRPDDHRRALMFIHAFLGWIPGIKGKR